MGIKCYTVLVGNVNPLMKRSREAVKYISTLEGLLGVHPEYPYGTFLVFDTLNNAKGARNKMRAKGIQTGKNISEANLSDDKKTLTIFGPPTESKSSSGRKETEL